jgi:predicted RNA methylase
MKEIKLTISDENKGILSRGRIDGNLYFLPSVVLSREKYLEINKVLGLCGGKWNRAKKAHIFESEEKAKSIIEAQEKGEVIDKKKTFQFFETSEKVAKQMVELAEIKDGMVVLEPSAGHGAIAEAIAKYGGSLDIGLMMVEIDPEKCKVLDSKKIGNVLCEDFLGTFAKEYGKFARILMNPPFSEGQDAEHILHAYENCLEEGGRLVSVASASVEFNSQKKYKKLRELIEKSGKTVSLPQGCFKESGTNVNALIVILNK